MVKNVSEKKKVKLPSVGYPHCPVVRLASKICSKGKW